MRNFKLARKYAIFSGPGHLSCFCREVTLKHICIQFATITKIFDGHLGHLVNDLIIHKYSNWIEGSISCLCVGRLASYTALTNS